MRIGLVITLSLAILVAGSAAAVEGKPTAKAALKLTRGAPLTLRGTQFRSKESVRLVVVAQKRITKTLRANEAGSFVVRLPGITVGGCQGFTAFADRRSREPGDRQPAERVLPAAALGAKRRGPPEGGPRRTIELGARPSGGASG